MAQPQSKRPIGISSVGGDRSVGVPLSARAADGSLQSARTRQESSERGPLDVLDDLVFEEIGATPLNSFVRQVATEPEKKVQEPVVEIQAPTPVSSPTPAPVAAADVTPHVSSSQVPAPSANLNVKHSSTKPIAHKSSETKLTQSTSESGTRNAADPTSVPPQAGPATGTREYFDLRGQLNRKEGELLELRRDLNSKERTLLETKDKLLESERARLELSERLEQTVLALHQAQEKLGVLESEKSEYEKRLSEARIALRRNDENWKKKSESELDALRKAHYGQLQEHDAAYAAKLAQLEGSYSTKIGKLHASHAATVDELEERHAAAVKAAEAAGSAALSSTISEYAKQVQALSEAHERALAKAEAAFKVEREAARLTAETERARAVAEVEAAHRLTKNELTATTTTVQFLERARASSSERLGRLQSRVTELEEQLKQASDRTAEDAELLARLRKALTDGLSLLAPAAPLSSLASPGAGDETADH